MIYGIFLTIGVILCIGGLIFIPINTTTANDTTANIELVPTDIIIQNEDVREFHFNNIDWSGNGPCMHFVSTHQEVKVEADGVLIFERKVTPTIWGKSTGFAWEYIQIPVNTKEVIVTITACYPVARDTQMTFYQGFGLKMFQQLFHQEGFNMVVSFLNISLGLILLMYGAAMRKRTSIGITMIYLGIFTVLLGIWSISENGIIAVLVENRAACSFISYTILTMVGIPFIMFVYCYLQPEDKYVHKIVLGLNILNIILVFPLHLCGIRDMKQTLLSTHIAMLVAFLYLPFSLLHMLRKHHFTQRFWITLGSLLVLCIPLAYSLHLYYTNSYNVNSYGNVFIFIFIMIFAIDVSRSIMKDIDEGKKAAIYHELAITDLLTGCYNRNAYRRDTSNWTDLQDVLLITCDLNNLKQCNDTLGHTYGDQYITDSAAILKKIFSQYGNVYRIGGDEFCIIIPDSHKCSIGMLLADLTEEERLYNVASKVIRLQIACGYAEFNAEIDSNMEDIRIRADEQMYKNKKELKAGNLANAK
jgi:diguanylate cyclase (GGDEF)-like protein